MIKKWQLILLALLVVGLAGCGQSTPEKATKASNGDEASTPSQQANPKNLEIIESGYEVVSSEYGDMVTVYYGIVIKNPNKELKGEFPGITVEMRDESDKVLAVDEMVLQDILPGQELAYGGRADANGERPATVSFTLSVDKDNWSKPDPNDYGEFEFTDVEIKDGATFPVLTGEIVSSYSEELDDPAVTTLFRDADGKIVSGDTGYIDGTLVPGEKKAFQVDMLRDLPEYATTSISAMPWL